MALSCQQETVWKGEEFSEGTEDEDKIRTEDVNKTFKQLKYLEIYFNCEKTLLANLTNENLHISKGYNLTLEKL